MSRDSERRGPGRKIALFLIPAFLLLTAAAYFVGYIFFNSHFLPGTTINGFRCDFMTVREAEKVLKREVNAYAMEIDTMRNGVESISGKDIELTYESDGSVQTFLDGQEKVRWFLALREPGAYHTGRSVSWNQRFLEVQVDELDCLQKENMKKPVNASIVSTAEGFVISPETTGSLLDRNKVLAVIEKALGELNPKVSLEEEECYLLPTLYRDDPVLVENCEYMNTLKDVVITYDFGDRSERVDFDRLKSWFVQDKRGIYSLDRDQAAAFVRHLGEVYDTVGEEREFLTYDDRLITLEAGDYGWIIDTEAETRELLSLIDKGTIEVREPVYRQTAASRGQNDIGASYIEINLEEQRLVCYDDGKPVLDCSIVSGAPYSSETHTPMGCYEVLEKEDPPRVDDGDIYGDSWFLLRFHDNLGIHDADWREEFGKDIYMIDGTPGCVNVPFEAMSQLYSLVEEGTPVVIYE